MFPHGIFFIPCYNCKHSISLPRLSPLGWYADRHFLTPDEVNRKDTQKKNSKDTPKKKEFVRIWPVEFACMNCQSWSPYPEIEICKLEAEDEGFAALAEVLGKSSLWQLETAETGLPPGESKMYIVAPSDILPEDLKQAVLRMVGPDQRKLGDQREIKATIPIPFSPI